MGQRSGGNANYNKITAEEIVLNDGSNITILSPGGVTTNGGFLVQRADEMAHLSPIGLYILSGEDVSNELFLNIYGLTLLEDGDDIINLAKTDDKNGVLYLFDRYGKIRFSAP